MKKREGLPAEMENPPRQFVNQEEERRRADKR
jgi:hypothetical protein